MAPLEWDGVWILNPLMHICMISASPRNLGEQCLLHFELKTWRDSHTNSSPTLSLHRKRKNKGVWLANTSQKLNWQEVELCCARPIYLIMGMGRANPLVRVVGARKELMGYDSSFIQGTMKIMIRKITFMFLVQLETLSGYDHMAPMCMISTLLCSFTWKQTKWAYLN